MKNIPLFKVFMSQHIGEYITDTLLSGFIGQGAKVEEFESLLKNKFTTDNLITVNSGTSAIHTALHLLKHPFYEMPSGVEGGAIEKWHGINNGDEVLTTPLTCLATNMPILANGLKIKWVDIDKTTMNMDLDDLESKITEKTKAIIVVHWGGYPVDLDRLKSIQLSAQKRLGFKPAIIEDCAHAFGTKFNGKLLGNHGNLCAFSFQAIKHLTTADGGMLILPYPELYKKAKLFRWYGIDRDGKKMAMRCEDDVKEWGFKFHLNDVNATIGIENMKYVDGVVHGHKSNSNFYDRELRGVAGIELLKRDDRAESASWIYSLLVDRKTDFINHLQAHGIAVSQVHERNDKHSCFSEFVSPLPNLDEVIPKLISIPVGWWVYEDDRQYIVDTIKKGW